MFGTQGADQLQLLYKTGCDLWGIPPVPAPESLTLPSLPWMVDGESDFICNPYDGGGANRDDLAFILVTLVLLFILLYGYNRRRVHQAEEEFPPAGSFVSVEGHRLHYVSKGDGKPIVFLHGGILSTYDYSRVLDLVHRDCRAIAFDRPRYGYSERPRREKVTATVQARLLHGALQKVGVERPVLAGHSMSGPLVLSYALNYPREISGAVLLGAAVYGGEAYPASRGNLLLSRLITTPVIGDFLSNTVLPPLGCRIVNSVVKATFAPDPAPPEYLKLASVLWPRPGQIKANWEDILYFSPTASQLSPRYPEIWVPVAIVIGEQDPFLDPKLQSNRLHRELPHSRLIKLPDTSHMIPTVRPEALFDALRWVWSETADQI